MGDIKFGVSQLSSPAPKGWRNFERAFIIAFSPALSGFLAVVLTNQRHLAIAGAAIIFVNGVVKAFGMFLGNGTVYADREQQTDSKPENQ